MPLVVRVFLVVDFSASFMPIVAKNLSNIEDIDVGLVCVIPSDIKLVTLSLRSVSRSHVSKKKYNLVSLSQLNTLNNTDTVIDLNLNTKHLIDQPFSIGPTRNCFSKRYLLLCHHGRRN